MTGAPDFTRVRRIACVGEVMIELVAEGADRAAVGVAGDSYNTAVYLARLLGAAGGGGRVVSYVTALGVDGYSDRILAHMAAHGVDASLVERRADKAPGLYAIDTDEAGERSFTYWRSDSAARTLFRAPCKVGTEALDAFDLIYLSGISLAILPEPVRQALYEALDRFRGRGGLVAYDSNHRPRLWQSREAAQAANMAMWRRADLALPSLDDEIALFGDPSVETVLERLRAAGAGFGALKRGAAGPLPLAPDLAPPAVAPAPRVVDTTAAGDSFDAGVIAALVEGCDLSAALVAGPELASKVVQAKGAIVPT